MGAQGVEYTIYCDMDGVLCDFDKRFMEFSNGIPPSQYENEFGKKAFWELISKKGVGFWSEMEWKIDKKDPETDEKDSKKTGGKTLVSYSCVLLLYLAVVSFSCILLSCDFLLVRAACLALVSCSLVSW